MALWEFFSLVPFLIFICTCCRPPSWFFLAYLFWTIVSISVPIYYFYMAGYYIERVIYLYPLCDLNESLKEHVNDCTVALELTMKDTIMTVCWLDFMVRLFNSTLICFVIIPKLKTRPITMKMKNSTKSDIGVRKKAAVELFANKFAIAVRQERMSLDR